MTSFRRHFVAVSLAGVCLAAVGTVTITVPAAVAAMDRGQITIEQPGVDAAAQSFQLSTPWEDAAAVMQTERDGFGVTEFSVVQWPLAANTPISSYFGYRECAGCSTMHSGIDLTPGAGTPIEAISDGVVVASTSGGGSWGVHVTIEHNIDGVTYRSSYAHMQAGSKTVEIGDTVTRGQVLGKVGSTGQSTGAHLHFTVQTADGAFINPLPWMQQHVNIAD